MFQTFKDAFWRPPSSPSQLEAALEMYATKFRKDLASIEVTISRLPSNPVQWNGIDSLRRTLLSSFSRYNQSLERASKIDSMHGLCRQNLLSVADDMFASTSAVYALYLSEKLAALKRIDGRLAESMGEYGDVHSAHPDFVRAAISRQSAVLALGVEEEAVMWIVPKIAALIDDDLPDSLKSFLSHRRSAYLEIITTWSWLNLVLIAGYVDHKSQFVKMCCQKSREALIHHHVFEEETYAWLPSYVLHLRDQVPLILEGLREAEPARDQWPEIRRLGPWAEWVREVMSPEGKSV